MRTCTRLSFPIACLVIVPLFAIGQEPSAAPFEPDSSFNLSGRLGEDEAEAAGDLLLPLCGDEQALIFVNPRLVGGDEGRQEFNGGLVFRSMQSGLKGILGANIYYDYRQTESDANFHQVGAGIEYMGERFDFRANYYKPENSTERVNEQTVVSESVSRSSHTDWDDPYSDGHAIIQRGRVISRTVETTTRQTFFQYESPLEGWDTEVGVLVPCLEKLADVRLYGGCYHFNGELGADDVAGMKARCEVRILAHLVVGAEWYEDKDLYGSDYFVGARVEVPFQLAGGPRVDTGGWLAGMERGRELKDRMLEPVMRDWHVQTTTSGFEEDHSKLVTESEVTAESVLLARQTLANDVLFVNEDTGDDANPGTQNEPLKNIETGMANGERVFVMRSGDGYDVNLRIEKDLDLMGQGYPIGSDGKYLDGDSRYTRLRPDDPARPTIRINGDQGASDVLIRGFDISGCENGLAASDYPLVVVRARDVPKLEIHDNRIHCGLAGILARYSGMTQSYSLTVHDNSFDHLGLGAGIWAQDSSGSVVLRNNRIDTTAIGAGALAMANGGGNMTMDLNMTGNTVGPGGLQTIGSLIINTNGIVGQLVQGFIGPLDPAIQAAIAGIPPDSLSLLGLAGVGISQSGASLDMNAYIGDNAIDDNLLGIALGGYGPGLSLDDAVIENNTIRGGGTDTLFKYIHEQFLSVPYDWQPPFEFSLSGIAAASLNGASMNNLAIRKNVLRDELLGIAAVSFGNAQMNGANIVGNSMDDSGLGILAVAEGGAQANDMTIADNTINGAGLGELADVVAAHFPTSTLPVWADDVLATLSGLDYGAAGIVVDANAISATPGTEMNGLVLARNRVRDNLLGIGVVGNAVDMKNGQLVGNTIENALVASTVLAQDSDLSGWKISDNNIDPVLGGIVLAAIGSKLDSIEVSRNNIEDSTVGILFALLEGSTARNAVMANNVISGGIAPDQLALLELLVGALDLADEVEDGLGMDERGLGFPGDLPATGGYSGFVGLLDDAGEVDLAIRNSQITQNELGLFLQSYGNVPNAQLSLTGNQASGPYLLIGSEMDVTHSGNVPNVVIMP